MALIESTVPQDCAIQDTLAQHPVYQIKMETKDPAEDLPKVRKKIPKDLANCK